MKGCVVSCKVMLCAVVFSPMSYSDFASLPIAADIDTNTDIDINTDTNTNTDINTDTNTHIDTHSTLLNKSSSQ